jgi:hypothetical protein
LKSARISKSYGENKIDRPPAFLSLNEKTFSAFLEVPGHLGGWYLRQKHVSQAGGYTGSIRYAE